MGVSCTIVPGGTVVPGTGSVALDQAIAAMIIMQSAGGSQATVSCTLTDVLGRTIELGESQSVSINDVALSGPDLSDRFTATLAAADTYTITVREPTIGVQDTTVAAPSDFAITAPAAGGDASLSGFTLNWSEADASLQVRIELLQTFAGETAEENFGPLADNGSYTFDANDLRSFVQGVDLVVTVTRINTLRSVAGLGSANVSVRTVATQLIEPAP